MLRSSGGKLPDFVEKSRLLGTVSAVAMAAYFFQSPNLARAEEPRMVFELHRGSVSGDKQPWAQRAGFGGPSDTSILDIAPEHQLGGTIGFITPTQNHKWDVGVFARFGITDEKTDANNTPYLFNILGGYFPPYYYSQGRVEHQEQHLIVDFEARRDVGLGSDTGAKTTLKTGVRFAYFNAETDTEFVSQYFIPPYILRDTRRSRFMGAGPHIGIDNVQPLAENFSFDISAGASLLLGQRNTSNRTFFSAFSDSNSSGKSEFDMVPGLDARASLTYRSPENGLAISLGVEANAWFGLHDQTSAFNLFSPEPVGNKDADRQVVSPFVSVSMPLGSTLTKQSGVPDDASFTGAQPPTEAKELLLEAGIWRGETSRSGDELNFGTGAPTEIENYPLGGVTGLAALPIGGSWLAQLEAVSETTYNNASVDGVDADDTYAGGHTIGGHLAYNAGNFLFGVFGGRGETEIHSTLKDTHDASHEFYGVEGRFLSDHSSLAVQIGNLDTSALNPEVISNALFGRIVGQVFVNDGKTMFQGKVAYASGHQDKDSSLGPDGMDVFSWGLSAEHQLYKSASGIAASAFVSFEELQVAELSSFGITDNIEDHTIMAGVKIRFGGDDLHDREGNKAPDLPNVIRWIGATPAVD